MNWLPLSSPYRNHSRPFCRFRRKHPERPRHGSGEHDHRTSRAPGTFGVAALSLLLITSLEARVDPADKSLEAFSFSFPGGLSWYSDNYEFSPPSALRVSRRFTFRLGEAPRTCTYQIPQCGASGLVHVCDLEGVLSDPQVHALWSRGEESVYGRDPRHQDGGVFTIEVQGKGSLTVGELCGENSVECSEEHEALIRLRQVVTDLSRQAHSSPECTDLER